MDPPVIIPKNNSFKIHNYSIFKKYSHVIRNTPNILSFWLEHNVSQNLTEIG